MFEVGEHSIMIPGPCGDLEAIITIPKEITAPLLGVVCHPHPLQQGTMLNKVVTTVSRSLRDKGYINIRFNYRGVRRSAGEYGHGLGETEDLLAVLAWAKQQELGQDYLLAGFSFGSFVAANGAKQWPCQQLITIAPSVVNMDYSQLTELGCPWYVIQGGQDDVVEPEAVYEWAEQMRDQVELIKLPEADHFFHGKLVELKQILLTIIP